MDESPTDLVGKEFIFEYGIDRILPPSDKTGGLFATEQRAYRRERVIRCRDCGYSITFNTGQMCCLRTSRFVDQHDFCSKAVEKWES